ncbi:MAG: Lrp/AsnC family transcriptional regulator, leucine-responsive regulatory protein [archaeon GW2011_AR3]|nr:MAG: Lrp/AsnC family transcriptional regulator, leucine-responsive regulatory protein [archaeon GW2011_AR3]
MYNMAEFKLDKKDRAIIRALEENGRAMIKDISKKTGIPRDSVNYRIRKLVGQKVIKGFVPVCDTLKMGYPIYSWVTMQLQNFNEETEKKFRNYLHHNRNVIYIARVTGDFHYIITVAAKSIPEFDIVLRELLAKFPNLIKSYTTSLLIEEAQYDTFYRLIE